LERVGYGPDRVNAIVNHIDATGTIEGAPGLEDAHLPIFDCSFKTQNGERAIQYRGHLRMMAAVQPFISGAISKTINMPEDTTIDDVVDAYKMAWDLGLKSIAIYRDGSKSVQPLTTSDTEKEVKEQPEQVEVKVQIENQRRVRLPDVRKSITHRFVIGGHKGYITAGMYDSGKPGEIFIRIAKEGSTLSGLLDNFATSISLALQYGTPLNVLVEKFKGAHFEPSGWTSHPEIKYAKSITDYIFRWLWVNFGHLEMEEAEKEKKRVEGMKGGVGYDMSRLARLSEEAKNPNIAGYKGVRGPISPIGRDPGKIETGPPCTSCGTVMEVSGTCYRCPNCGVTSGCG